MAVIVDEVAGTISFTDCTITFPFGFDVSTGVGTIMITPSGGVASFPLAIQGSSGLPPNIEWKIEEVDPLDALPDPNPLVVPINDGGPGVASEWEITIYVHKGDKGDAAAFNILDGDDIEGAIPNGYVLAKKTGVSKVEFIPMRTGDVRSSASIPLTNFTATNPRLLTTVAVAAKPFPQKISPQGFVVVSGSVDTRVDLVAYLGNPDAGGVEIGRGAGHPGAAPPPVFLAGVPPNTGTGADADYGILPANTAGSVYFRAEQMASSSNGWATAAAPNGARLGVVAVAL